jgi:hypothetical protein
MGRLKMSITDKALRSHCTASADEPRPEGAVFQRPSDEFRLTGKVECHNFMEPDGRRLKLDRALYLPVRNWASRN